MDAGFGNVDKDGGVGVSRSGRIRKKSSKFADFESPDKIDIDFDSTSRADKMDEPEDFDDSDGDSDPCDDIDVKDEPLDEDDDDLGDYSDFMAEDIKEEDDDKYNSLQIDEDSQDENQRDSRFSQANSLYMSEKLSKKNVLIKDGQVIQKRKAQRKDKGKSRFTAYMLWAREVRHEIIEANPNMDFSAVNKRLGEMWALVSNTQKFNWKRRAKKLAATGNSKASMISTGKPPKQQNLATKSNLINKIAMKPQTSKGSSKQIDTSANRMPSHQHQQKILLSPKGSRTTNAPAIGDASPPGGSNYKVNECNPIDVAAHLKLLGESLNNIGQKLKEHEGQIAVSGSLSVLLDSMLCVLGPLTCLTNQVDELKGAVPEATLNNILDNIAYIMPGIV